MARNLRAVPGGFTENFYLVRLGPSSAGFNYSSFKYNKCIHEIWINYMKI